MNALTLKVAVVTLGCAKNSVDSSYMRASIKRGGAEIVDDPSLADVVVVNTCGFIEPAKRESIETLLAAASLKGPGKSAKIVATGCLVERYGEELAAALPEVDLFVDLAGEREIWTLIEREATGLNRGASELRGDYGSRYADGKPFDYLMIADGCSNHCSYCAIPMIRGLYKSRPMREVLEEAEYLVNNGVKEISLIAQDTTAYGLDLYGERKLPELVLKLANLDGLQWLRILYAQPQHMSEGLISAMRGADKVCAYLDLPLQHASDRIIASMRRWGNRQAYLNLIERLRSELSTIALRTSVIVGYPGETEEDFEQLVEFVKRVEFDFLGIFEFSPEQGTPAAEMLDQVDPDVASERSRELSELQDGIMRRRASARVGRRAEILVEAIEDGNIVGRAPWQAPEVDGNVYLNGEAEIGKLLEVEITWTDGFDYKAKPAERSRQ